MTKTKSQNGYGLKLNYKRTFLIGFAFFGICLLWQVYDSWCPTFLTDILARKLYGVSSAGLTNQADVLNVQWIVGIVMAADNLAALILLPIFGNLSDKTNTKIGKRMPYILIGTFIAAFVFPFIPIFFHKHNIVGMIIAMGIILIVMMCYRNPAVALMPDITPKPLRAKANGIINIVGYFGGAFAVIMGLIVKLSDYIAAEDAARNLWIIETPFLVASVLMVISALVLFFTIKENKLRDELKDDMELGEKEAAIEDAVDDNKPMSKKNKVMLLGILGAEFLWFMADNALSTYANNFAMYYLRCASSSTMILTIIMGLTSVVGFAIAGNIADKIGRKFTVSLGLAISLVGMILMCFAFPEDTTAAIGTNKLPWLLYVTFAFKGFGMSLVHNCSFPMVVELCSSKKIGKFTGYYYAASMSAQTITPVLIGLILGKTGSWNALPIYSTILIALSLATFFFIVKNIKAKKLGNVKGLEALGADND